MNVRHGLAFLLLTPAAFAGGSVVGWAEHEASQMQPDAFSASCRVVETEIELPGSLDESSGIAVGMRDSSIFWSHNDGGAFIVGFDRRGKRLARIDLEIRNRDWEDMAVGPCDGGSCLYIADTGDNDERRDNLRVVRMSEPAPDVTRIDPQSFDLSLPDGPRDIEAMYILPGEQLYFVTKGRNDLITIYRYPGVLRDGEIELEEVQNLGSPANPLEWVTGASATRDGRHVAIRSYATLYLYRVLANGELELLPDGEVGLLAVREAQGEAVGFGADGLLYLTSERRNKSSAEMSVMECELE